MNSSRRELDELADTIEVFEANLPGWWWSVGSCSASRQASCGPDWRGPDAGLLKYPEFDTGFHVYLEDGFVYEALETVMKRALAYKEAHRQAEELELEAVRQAQREREEFRDRVRERLIKDGYGAL